MKLPSYRRILKTDFKEEYQELVDKLSVSINHGFDSLYDALNKKLNFKDNISSTISTFDVTVDSTGKPTQSTQFKLDASQSTLEGLIVIQAYGAKDPTILPNSGLSIDFARNEKYVVINNIKGLITNVPYRIKVIALS